MNGADQNYRLDVFFKVCPVIENTTFILKSLLALPFLGCFSFLVMIT